MSHVALVCHGGVGVRHEVSHYVSKAGRVIRSPALSNTRSLHLWVEGNTEVCCPSDMHAAYLFVRHHLPDIVAQYMVVFSFFF
jgi:hypothetical protein